MTAYRTELRVYIELAGEEEKLSSGFGAGESPFVVIEAMSWDEYFVIGGRLLAFCTSVIATFPHR